jgi:CDP-4-dehydro-6-deoxyglucose reductase
VIHVLTVLPDGARMPVRPGETMLAASRRYGYLYTVGCREGGCAGCALQLVSGEVAYPKTVAQSVLSDQDRAGGVCLPCRAVPVTDVVIKLNRSDQLRRGPFSDRLAERDLRKAGLATGGPGVSATPTSNTDPATGRSTTGGRPRHRPRSGASHVRRQDRADPRRHHDLP